MAFARQLVRAGDEVFHKQSFSYVFRDAKGCEKALLRCHTYDIADRVDLEKFARFLAGRNGYTKIHGLPVLEATYPRDRTLRDRQIVALENGY